MTPLVRTLAVTLAVALAVPAAAAQGAVLQMALPTQQRLGILTTPLAAARRASSVHGFARALDAGPLAVLDADIAAAAAALTASQAEAARARTLNAADQTVSRKASEAATAQARTDVAKLSLLRRRLGLEWGPSIAALSDGRRGQLVIDIAAGRAMLVRIDASGGLAQLKGAVTLDLGAGGMARAEILGPARLGDPRLQSTGLLALVRGPQAMQLGVGAVAPAAFVSGGAATGVVIPREALLRTAGQTFAYVRRNGGSFERRPVLGGAPDPGGLFIADGFRPGELVVTKGAAQLFAAETSHAKAD